MIMPDPHDPVALSDAERRRFEAIVDDLTVEDPELAARLQIRSDDGYWLRWARRRRLR